MQENGQLDVHLLRKPDAEHREQVSLQQKPRARKSMEWQLLDAVKDSKPSAAPVQTKEFTRELTDEEEFQLTARLRDFSTSDWVRDRLFKAGIFTSEEESPRIKKLMKRFRKDIWSGGEKNHLLATTLSYLSLNPIEFERKTFDLFMEWIPNRLNVKDIVEEQSEVDKLADLRDPHLWYAAARQQRRKMIAHVGPTNSGKTFGALQAFMKAPSGLYCGPLRLLAHEVYEKVNNAGVLCNLITGQLSHINSEAKHTACTIEMADVSKPVDCAIIDEFQLLGDHHRGWAWSRALLGLPAHEIHVSGSDSCLGLMERLCKATGDELVVNNYQRLSSLRVLPYHLPNLRDLRKGDCVVAFSRREIYRLKAEIEQATDLRCSVVYGSLPPATRTQQAKLFNDPHSDYDVLVASDAIGMGLNLNIRRLVFSAMDKFDGIRRRYLNDAEIKQIAGRAGRFGGQYPEGEVTCMRRADLNRLQLGLSVPSTPIECAGIQPTGEQLELFMQAITLELEANRAASGKRGKTATPKFSTVLEHFLSSARVARDFFLCQVDDMTQVARLIDEMPLQLRDRYSFCTAPVNTEDSQAMAYLRAFARSFALTGHVSLVLKVPPLDVQGPIPEQLRAFESLHHIIEMYMWLAQRFNPGVFVDLPVALLAKEQCEQTIEQCLVLSSTSGVAPRKSRRR